MWDLLQGRTAPPPLPVVCALALLPPGPSGRAQVPAAVQPLMDAGSPVADLYAVCPKCEALLASVQKLALENFLVCSGLICMLLDAIIKLE